VKKLLLTLSTLVLLLIAPASCLATFDQAYWHYYKELPVASSGFSAVKLDQEVMRGCQENFSDLRVTDQAGREISSQVIQPDKERMDLAATELDRFEYPTYTSLVLDLGPTTPAHNRIDVDMESDKDYMREVTLEASQDNKTWGKIGQGRIMMFHGKIYNTVSFTTSTTRYLRVNIKQVSGEKRLLLNAVRVYFMPVSLYKGLVIPTKILSKRSDRNITNIVLDLKVPNYFINRVTIQTPDRNYERVVDIASDTQTSKSNQTLRLSTETIFDYQWQGYSSTRDYIEINQYARRYLFLSINNVNSTPLKITGLEVTASTPYLLADLKGPARLWYGNPNTDMANYDLGKFANLVQLTDLKWVTPSAQQVNPTYKVPFTEQHKWLLDTLIILVGAAFVLIIIRNFDKIKDLGKVEK